MEQFILLTRKDTGLIFLVNVCTIRSIEESNNKENCILVLLGEEDSPTICLEPIRMVCDKINFGGGRVV